MKINKEEGLKDYYNNINKSFDELENIINELIEGLK